MVGAGSGAGFEAPLPSPNHTERRGVARPSLVVLHFTAMASAAAARARLCDPAAEVSCHWLIAASGAVEQLVAEERRAWHAGAGEWAGAGDVNSRSIGIELDNLGDRPFAAAQMLALEGLLAGILARWQIPPAGVIAHSDMAPGRKFDPGARFDWRRLARMGLSVWPDLAPEVPPEMAPEMAPQPLDAPARARLQVALRRFGYPDLGLAQVLPAFRLRFRPAAHGPADSRDLALALKLAARWPALH